MIRLQKFTPEVYYEQSRDFQFIGRLYDVVLNSVKTNADIIRYGLPFSPQSPQELLALLSMTLGFKPKHRYSQAQLLAICNVFSEVLRNKGNLKAIQLIGEAILRTEGILGKIQCFMQYNTISGKNLPIIKILVPEKLAEIALFYDLLDYVIPAGCLVEIARGELLEPIVSETSITPFHEVTVLRALNGNEAGKVTAINALPKSAAPIISEAISDTKKLAQNHIANSIVWRRRGS